MPLNAANLSRTILLAITLCSPIVAQNTRVELGKHSTAIPKACVSVSPAVLEPTIDTAALVKEAICKGSGDMMSDYTYTVDALKRLKDKNGKVKDELITYEVFIPTLKAGTRTRGVLVVTSRNQVPVPPDELEKERMKAAERIEKEESKIEHETPVAAGNATSVTGMTPLGQHTRTGSTRTAFGVKKAGVSLAVPTFLRTCDLTFVRREQVDARETLVFSFTPRPDAQFIDDERYIAQLKGEIWIDAQDRIVTRLIGKPAGTPDEQPPAVYVEMMRLPQHGIWLPRMTRINGADYRKLFDGVTTDSTSTHSNYIRFSAEVNDVKVGSPNH
jgi:hypothetical protein